MCHDVRMNQSAPRYDHILNQGAEYRFRSIVRDETGALVNLTGYTVSMKARIGFADGAILLDLLSSTSPTFIETTSTGEINISIPASVTANYTPAEYVYTMKAWPTGSADNSDRVLEGVIDVRPQVTT